MSPWRFAMLGSIVAQAILLQFRMCTTLEAQEAYVIASCGCTVVLDNTSQWFTTCALGGPPVMHTNHWLTCISLSYCPRGMLCAFGKAPLSECSIPAVVFAMCISVWSSDTYWHISFFGRLAGFDVSQVWFLHIPSRADCKSHTLPDFEPTLRQSM